jgi:hypothetical protein
VSELITFPLPAGPIYTIPDVGDQNWGQNVTNFLVAIPAGVLPTAGTFTLTGDVSFAGGFSLISPTFKSSTINPASAGFLRLAKTDAIEWRNNANSADLALAINGSDQLMFNGASFVTGGSSPTFASLTLSSPLTVPNGGTGDTSFSAYSVICGGTTTTSPLQNVSGLGLSGQALTSNGPGTLPTWQNVAGSGTVNTGTAGNFAYYATSTNVVSDSGVSFTAPVFTGWVVGNTFRSTALSNQLSFTNAGGGNQIRTINIAPTTTIGEVVTLPDSGGSDTFALLGAVQTFTALTTLNSGKLGGNLNANSNKVVSLASATTNGDALAYGQSSWSLGAGTITGALSMSSNKITNLANGTAASDAAAFGQLPPALKAPTVQRFSTAGSGTYTTPTSPSPLYLKVRVISGGGGGSGSGSGGGAGGNGGNGGTSSFFNMSCSGGSGSTTSVTNSIGGTGGNASAGGGITYIEIQNGTNGSQGINSGSIVSTPGGIGGPSINGGSGISQDGGTGASGLANTGGGGAGGGMGGTTTVGGGGGGSGAYLEGFITSPAATYSYAVGAGGTAGAAGAGVFAGGTGGSGLVVVEEFYQ